MFSFENLSVWQKAIAWSDDIFEIAECLPQRWQFSFGEQLRRACLSVSNNLAEGSGRRTPAYQRNFYDIARGSVFEVVNILVLLKRRDLVNDIAYSTLYKQAEELSALIYRLIQAANESEVKGRVLREDAESYGTFNDAE